jgi:hypothetical protein
MADIVTGTVTGAVDLSELGIQHAAIRHDIASSEADIRLDSARESGDIRRESAESAANIRREGAEHEHEITKESIKGDWRVSDAVKDARHDNIVATDEVGDRLTNYLHSHDTRVSDRFFTVARDTADLRAQVIQAIDTTKLATELNALKGIIEGQKNTQYLADKIVFENEKTRALVNDLKYHDLNRALVERNAELVEEREGRRHWRGAAEQNQFGAQFAQLQSMMQNFNSQLQDTRQGMVNFGTMAGVGQSSTSNNVR